MQTENQLISIIMPAYNVGKFIAQTIESILAQTYTNWELIIIDDGSTDRTKEIIDTFLKKDARIKYVYQENSKQGKARNKGIEMAQSEIIAFMDADDILIPEMLEEQYNLLQENNADLSFSSVTSVDEELNDLNFPHSFPYNEVEGINGAEKLLEIGNPIPIITVVAKKKSIIDAGCFKVSTDLQFAEEYSLWLRMLLNGCKFVRNDKRVAYYIFHPNQSSRLATNKYLQILKMIKELPEPFDFKKSKEKYSRIWIRRSLKNIKNIDSGTLRKLSYFLPSDVAKNISIISSSLLPATMARKILYKLSYSNRI